MTCIVGLVQGTGVWIGGDSAGSNSSFIMTRKDPKVFRVGEMLMGCCGSFRMAQLLRCTFEPPAHPEEMDVERYLVGPFIDAVRRLFKDGGAATSEKEAERGTFFLLGYRGGLYRIEHDYHVGQAADGYDAIGSGSDFALGALHALAATRSRLAPPDRIRLALEASERSSPSVRGPFIIEQTEKPQVKERVARIAA